MADEGSALVVWGSTGRRLQFSMQDLKMPDSLRTDPRFHFYEKQWDAVAGFWFNRVLKESALQHLEVDQIVDRIRADIDQRWERRRQEQSIHKKRKRLLQSSGGPAGTPSSSVLLTNVVPLETYTAATEEEREALLRAVVDRVASVAKDAVSTSRVLVDDTAAPPSSTEESAEPAVKRARNEGGASGDAPSDGEVGDEDAKADAPVVAFDDRVAVVCSLSSKEKAALAIAHLHGSKFDGRKVMCRFWNVA